MGEHFCTGFGNNLNKHFDKEWIGFCHYNDSGPKNSNNPEL